MTVAMTPEQFRVYRCIRGTDVVTGTHVESFSSHRLFIWTQDGSEAQVWPDGRTLWAESVEREESRRYSEYLRTGSYPSVVA